MGMTRFLDAHRAKTDKDSDVAATFCVAGEAADPATGNAQIRLRIVGEDRVDQVKKTLTKVIGVYVYSLSKAPLRDSSGLVLANKEVSCSSSSSTAPPPSIVNPNIRFLSDEEVAAKRGGSGAQPKDSRGGSSNNSSSNSSSKVAAPKK